MLLRVLYSSCLIASMKRLELMVTKSPSLFPLSLSLCNHMPIDLSVFVILAIYLFSVSLIISHNYMPVDLCIV